MQKGNIIEGITEFYVLKGIVNENRLKGRVITTGPIVYFDINISQDYQSFEGTIGRSSRRITGKRKE